MHRFFVPREAFSGDQITLDEAGLVHRLRNVLRLDAGDRVLLLDNSNWEYEVVLQTVQAGLIEGQVEQKRLGTGEPRTKVTLYQAILKGDRFEWVLQKGTEVGVSEFVPILSERCIVLDAHQLSEQKLNRWQKIVEAAAEQSRRSRLPPLQPPLLLAAACEQVRRSGGLSLLPWEEATRPLQQVLEEAAEPQRPFNVALFIGPEGGFSSEEVAMTQDYGVIPVSLGRRILRAETAGIVAAALVLYQYGDLS